MKFLSLFLFLATISPELQAIETHDLGSKSRVAEEEQHIAASAQALKSYLKSMDEYCLWILDPTLAPQPVRPVQALAPAPSALIYNHYELLWTLKNLWEIYSNVRGQNPGAFKNRQMEYKALSEDFYRFSDPKNLPNLESDKARKELQNNMWQLKWAIEAEIEAISGGREALAMPVRTAPVTELKKYQEISRTMSPLLDNYCSRTSAVLEDLRQEAVRKVNELENLSRTDKKGAGYQAWKQKMYDAEQALSIIGETRRQIGHLTSERY